MQRMRPTRANLDEREKAAKARARLHEARDWIISCPACEHVGTVHMPLVQLRRSRFICRECGSGRQHQDKAAWFKG